MARGTHVLLDYQVHHQCQHYSSERRHSYGDCFEHCWTWKRTRAGFLFTQHSSAHPEPAPLRCAVLRGIFCYRGARGGIDQQSKRTQNMLSLAAASCLCSEPAPFDTVHLPMDRHGVADCLLLTCEQLRERWGFNSATIHDRPVSYTHLTLPTILLV